MTYNLERREYETTLHEKSDNTYLIFIINILILLHIVWFKHKLVQLDTILELYFVLREETRNIFSSKF